MKTDTNLKNSSVISATTQTLLKGIIITIVGEALTRYRPQANFWGDKCGEHFITPSDSWYLPFFSFLAHFLKSAFLALSVEWAKLTQFTKQYCSTGTAVCIDLWNDSDLQMIFLRKWDKF